MSNIRVKQAEERRLNNNKQQSKLEIVRVSRGLSQSTLASESGVNIRNIQNYEQFARDIGGARISTLLDLCIVLKCSLVDILEDENDIDKLEQVSHYKWNETSIETIGDQFDVDKELYKRFCELLNSIEKYKVDEINLMVPEKWQLVLDYRYSQEMSLSQIAD